MKLLAIDPGNTQSAFVILHESLVILDKGILPNADMLGAIQTFSIEYGLRESGPDTLAVEMVESFGMAVGKEVFETVFWTGRFCQAWEPNNWHRVYRKEVKMHLCGSMRAKDGNIRQALIDKLGPQGVKKNKGPTYGVSKDAWSALAVGVTFMETKSSKEANGDE